MLGRGNPLAQKRKPALRQKRTSFVPESTVKWVPDSMADACYKCHESFNRITRRRHHCRSCGNVFCNYCSNHKISLPALKVHNPVRVCDACFDKSNRSFTSPTKSSNLASSRTTARGPHVPTEFAPTYQVVSDMILEEEDEQDVFEGKSTQTNRNNAHTRNIRADTGEFKPQNQLDAELFENVKEGDYEILRLFVPDVVMYLGDRKSLPDSLFPEHIHIQQRASRAASIAEEQDFVRHQLSLRGLCVNGTLMFSNYQLYFVPNEGDIPLRPGDMKSSTKTYKIPPVHRLDAIVSVPLLTIRRLESQTFEGKDLGLMEIVCKDVRTLRLCYMNLVECQKYSSFQNSIQCVQHYSKADFATSLHKTFAFRSISSDELRARTTSDSWPEVAAEWQRMHVGGPRDNYRLTSINKQYKFCDSYPNMLVVPRRISDLELTQLVEFRSRGRIPVLTWRRSTPKVPHARSAPVSAKQGGVLLRCSQPLVGLTNQRSAEDEKLFFEAAKANGVKSGLVIIDCRPLANAMAQTAMGAGYESVDNYKRKTLQDVTIEFLGIENIHVMRRAQRAVEAICSQVVNGQPFDWNAFGSSQYMHNIGSVLQGAMRVAQLVADDETVVVHCSDGWDRTAQVCSLAQLLLDPYYRTLKGFRALIAKDWNSFGHKFADRLGHGLSGHSERTETSPVFLQFIDCVAQLFRQYPCQFEFDERLLIHLADHIYSGMYGNFLVNSDSERQHAHIMEKTQSIWAVYEEEKQFWVNPLYEIDYHDDDCVCEELLNVDISRLQFWSVYYLRWDGAVKQLGGLLARRSDHNADSSFVLNMTPFELPKRQHYEMIFTEKQLPLPTHLVRGDSKYVEPPAKDSKTAREDVLDDSSDDEAIQLDSLHLPPPERYKSENAFSIKLPRRRNSDSDSADDMEENVPHSLYSVAVNEQRKNKVLMREIARLQGKLAFLERDVPLSDRQLLIESISKEVLNKIVDNAISVVFEDVPAQPIGSFGLIE